MKSPMCSTDVLIVGAGPVGLILAIGLAKQGIKSIVIEKQSLSFTQEQTDNAFDGRVLALSHGSIKTLQKLGIWESLSAEATPIKQVHVSQKGHLGVVTMTAQEMQVPALGYSIQGRFLGQTLWQTAKQCPQITLLDQSTLESFTQLSSSEAPEAPEAFAVTAQIATPEGQLGVQSHSLVGADGTDSAVRKGLGLQLIEKDYDAFGVLAQIETREHPQGLAFERFTPEGPMALLPMAGHFHKAVWVCPREQKDAIMGLSNEAFLEQFSARMGERLGGFVSVSKRFVYPLKETSLSRISEGCVVLMGNAAHTQHPVAAQGLNLGISDIAAFLQTLEKQTETFDRPVKLSNALLLSEWIETYAQERQAYHQKIMGLTDGLIQLFEHASPLVGHARGLGLMAMQAIPIFKQRLAKLAMGASKS